jgi:hypothetical protein
MKTDVSKANGTEQGIGNRVAHDVGIGMTKRHRRPTES